MPIFKQALTRAALWPLKWVGRLPLARAQRATGWLGRPLRLLMRRRARIVERNLQLCFPELNPPERKRLARAHFCNLAESIGEVAFAWHHPDPLDHSVGTVEGIEHLQAARAGDHGALLVTAHVTCLELGARVLGRYVDGSGIYRPLRNPTLERMQNEGRARYANSMIAQDDVRAMVRRLRDGGVLWYAPDQDPGRRRAAFAPLFGIEAATATGMLDLARLGRARVVPMFPVKDAATGRIRVVIEPAFEAFPSDDPAADLARFNEFIERHVRAAPATYWWLHRRFKTRPGDEPDRYDL